MPQVPAYRVGEKLDASSSSNTSLGDKQLKKSSSFLLKPESQLHWA